MTRCNGNFDFEKIVRRDKDAGSRKKAGSSWLSELAGRDSREEIFFDFEILVRL